MRFGALSLVPVEFEPVKAQKVILDMVEREKSSHHKPRALRWSRVKPEEGRKPLSKTIDAEKSFTFLCAYTLQEVTLNLFYPYRAGKSHWCLERTY